VSLKRENWDFVMRDAFIKELLNAARADNSIFLITGDLGFGVLDDFARELPNQFINAGIAEQFMTGMAAGIALEGNKSFTYSIGNFSTLRCLEQIRNDICYHDVNVTIVSVGAGFSYGQLGMTHFATEDLSIMRSLPNLKVIAPSDPWQMKYLIPEMLLDDSPKYLRIDKGAAGCQENFIPKIGIPQRLIDGDEVTIISIGSIASEAIKASEVLHKKGISTRVLLLNSLKPSKIEEIIRACNETSIIVTLEEHSIVGGLGSFIADVIVSNNTCPERFIKLGINDEFPEIVGDQSYLRRVFKLDSNSIVEIITKEMG
jgi:transketolase